MRTRVSGFQDERYDEGGIGFDDGGGTSGLL